MQAALRRAWPRFTYLGNAAAEQRRRPGVLPGSGDAGPAPPEPAPRPPSPPCPSADTCPTTSTPSPLSHRPPRPRRPRFAVDAELASLAGAACGAVWECRTPVEGRTPVRGGIFDATVEDASRRYADDKKFIDWAEGKAAKIVVDAAIGAAKLKSVTSQIQGLLADLPADQRAAALASTAQ